MPSQLRAGIRAKYTPWGRSGQPAAVMVKRRRRVHPRAQALGEPGRHQPNTARLMSSDVLAGFLLPVRKSNGRLQVACDSSQCVVEPWHKGCNVKRLQFIQAIFLANKVGVRVKLLALSLVPRNSVKYVNRLADILNLPVLD